MVVNERALSTNQPGRARNGVRIKTIALPAEHGGWGLLFEPIVLSLLLVPSVAGLYLALSAVGFFLARHPLTLLILNRGRTSPRTALAKRFATLYVVVGIASLLAAISFTENRFVLPLLIAAPLAFVQLTYDWIGRRRVLLSEMAGTVAISSVAAAVALAGGWSVPASFALWAITIARAVPAILYVRACLARSHQRPTSLFPAILTHALAVIAIMLLAQAALAPRLATIAMAVLWMRASIGLAKAKQITAKQLGFSEIGFGAATVFAVVLGHMFGV